MTASLLLEVFYWGSYTEMVKTDQAYFLKQSFFMLENVENHAGHTGVHSS